MIDLTAEDKEVNGIALELDRLDKNIEEQEIAFKRAEETVARTQDAQELLQLVAQAVQQRAHERVSTVVSSCLSTVFEDPYEFKILFERKRGRTEASLRFTRRGLDVDPLSASGGGVVDVAAFALRAACLMLHRPRLSKLIVLDEPFKFVSEEFHPNIRSMIEQLAEDLGLQIIFVTHIHELETGKIIRL